MASVNLGSRLFIHDADNPADYVTLLYTRWPEATKRGGEVRRYANGVRRAVRTKEWSATVTFDLQLPTPAEVDGLRRFEGRTVMVRGGRGRLLYGIYFEVATSDRGLTHYESASITVESLTYVATV